MATLAPMSTPMRQPFASLDGGRLRNLTNIKNQQNALPATLSSPVKRRYSPSTFDDLDSENVDPSIFSTSKKAKNSEGLPVKPLKTSQFILTNAFPTPATRPIITPSRLDTSKSSITQKRQGTQPSSAPAAAGRSPKSKRIGILSRRRTSSSPFTRVDPPSFGTSNGLPFSIDAALSGTVPSHKAKSYQHVQISTLEEAMPNSWLFDIHQDTMQEELGNLMQHSTCTLDISDDEGRFAAKDDRGKENIPPPDYPAVFSTPAMTAVRPATRRDMMTDEPRAPLGDLDAKEFYAEGCDASSYIIIPAEQCGEKPAEHLAVLNEEVHVCSPAEPRADTTTESQTGWEDLLARVEDLKNKSADTTLAMAIKANSPSAEIEIWESESAKGEGESTALEVSSGPADDGVLGQAHDVPVEVTDEDPLNI